MSSFASALAQSMWHPREITSMIKFKFSVPSFRSKLTIAEAAKEGMSDYDFAYLCLHKVSRSFAVVIQLLDPELRDSICLFYLILRGLDSVEDDMDYPFDKRIPLLRSFHEKLYEKGWNAENCGDTRDYKDLMASFDKIINVFSTLPKTHQEVIADITMKMGKGMADFAEKYHGKDLNGVDTVDEYELYCHYVAGLVGLGLDRLFVASGLENHDPSTTHILANSMGLFLQKVNITRDYLEDFEQKRSWWPKELWGKYSQELGLFAREPHGINARLALNRMIYNGLKHVPDVMTYCGKLQNQSIFNFCAIPQVMAISTLALLYNDTNVLTQTLKIRKGITCDVALNCTNMGIMKGFFMRDLDTIRAKLVHPREDPVFNSATEDQMALAIQLYEDMDGILTQSVQVCKEFTPINEGWELLIAGCVALGACVYGISQIIPPASQL